MIQYIEENDMNCKNCGAKNLDDAVVCEKCGKDPNSIGKMDAKDCKHWTGFLLAFLSVIGLGIGLYLYWNNPWRRRTFLGGFVVATFIIAIAVLVIFGISAGCAACTDYFNISCGNKLK